MTLRSRRYLLPYWMVVYLSIASLLLTGAYPLPPALQAAVDQPRLQVSKGMSLVLDKRPAAGQPCQDCQQQKSLPPDIGLNAAAVQGVIEPLQSESTLPQNIAPKPVYAELLERMNEPVGCRQPSHDYTEVQVSERKLNRRTYEMLEYAASLYEGKIDITGTAILNRNYLHNYPSSFAAHLEPGVVDFAVFPSRGTRMAYADIEPLIKALRVAGFAAWLREENEVFQGSRAHIHAVAIGDVTLSEDARQQLDGEYGYFYGYTGIPGAQQEALPDRHGGPAVCQWMVDAGYSAPQAVLQTSVSQQSRNWQEKLRLAAESYLTTGARESVAVAQRLDYLAGPIEHPSTMCGPLAAAILRDAGLLPRGITPASNLYNFWLANPRVDQRPRSLFPEREYDYFQFSTPINEFDFSAWPLYPGDFLYTYAYQASGFDHMFVVSEVDAAGRAYVISNEEQADGGFLIQRLLLYDPADPSAGALHNEWLIRHSNRMRTGGGGFDVLRKKGLNLPPGSRFEYAVEPGDTLASILDRYNSSLDTLIGVNQVADLLDVGVGQSLVIAVNLLEVSEAGAFPVSDVEAEPLWGPAVQSGTAASAGPLQPEAVAERQEVQSPPAAAAQPKAVLPENAAPRQIEASAAALGGLHLLQSGDQGLQRQLRRQLAGFEPQVHLEQAVINRFKILEAKTPRLARKLANHKVRLV